MLSSPLILCATVCCWNRRQVLPWLGGKVCVGTCCPVPFPGASWQQQGWGEDSGAAVSVVAVLVGNSSQRTVRNQ